ncbi:MAG TPA: glycosyltransferase family 39 protein [Candidatus Sulfotelmatobacter sp.]|nr:glycosyltransferase family 39 protein [Candidatus Sulfotelmatobacter sp.]
MRERFIALLPSPWFIALVALLLRTVLLLCKASVIPAEILATVPFQNEVGNVASALASGHGFCCLFRQPTGPTAWLAPVYPLLVAGVFKLLGTFTLRSFYAVVLLNCVFSALTCIPLFNAGERIAGRSAAALATWLWAFFPTGIILPYAWIWDSSLSALLAAALLWATLRLADSSRPLHFALYGFLWGISLLTNPSLGALLPFLLALVFFRHREANPQKLRLLLLAAAALLVICLPWTTRNYLQFHRFVPLRSNFAYEFWSGNNEIFDEHSRALNRITRYEQTHLYARLGENAFLDDKWQKAKSFVSAHPSLYAQLCARRIVATWLGTESPWQDFFQADSLLARSLLLWNAITLVGMIAGLVRLYLRQRPYFFPVAVFPLFFPIAFYLAHTSLRHRHPCDPVLALLLSVAIAGTGVRKTTEQV